MNAVLTGGRNAVLLRGARAGAAITAALMLAGVVASMSWPAIAHAAWSAETDCATCHAEQVEAIGAGDHGSLPCATCHSDVDALAAVHDSIAADTKAPTKLRVTAMDDGVCLACHGDAAAPVAPGEKTAPGQKVAADKEAAAGERASNEKAAAEGAGEKGVTDKPAMSAVGDAVPANKSTAVEDDAPAKTQLIASTADSAVLVDSEGTVVNPHDIPVVKEHEDIACATCHKLHDAMPDPAKAAMKKCTSCHHDNVFTCYTCHE